MAKISMRDIERARQDLSPKSKITIQQFDAKKGVLFLDLGPIREVFGMGRASYLEEELKKKFP